MTPDQCRREKRMKIATAASAIVAVLALATTAASLMTERAVALKQISSNRDRIEQLEDITSTMNKRVSQMHVDLKWIKHHLQSKTQADEN